MQPRCPVRPTHSWRCWTKPPTRGLPPYTEPRSVGAEQGGEGVHACTRANKTFPGWSYVPSSYKYVCKQLVCHLPGRGDTDIYNHEAARFILYLQAERQPGHSENLTWVHHFYLHLTPSHKQAFYLVHDKIASELCLLLEMRILHWQHVISLLNLIQLKIWLKVWKIYVYIK